MQRGIIPQENTQDASYHIMEPKGRDRLLSLTNSAKLPAQ